MNGQQRQADQALTILAIATAVFGFAVFQTDFNFTDTLGNPLGTRVGIAKFIWGFGTMAQYFRVFVTVRGVLLRDDAVTNKEIADGPLANLGWEMVFAAGIFVLSAVETPATD